MMRRVDVHVRGARGPGPRFSPASPSTALFAREILKTAPARPGIYLMLGANDELLYVGKAKNLRTRLLSYARHVPGTDRRLDSLLRGVRSVRWEECSTEPDARRKETELLRSLRPPHNAVHAELSKYLAIAVAVQGDEVRIRLASEPGPTPEAMYFYPFAAATATGLKALVRLLYMAQDGWTGREAPSNVTRSSGCRLQLAPALRVALFSFLDGRSPRLLRLTELEVVRKPALDPVRLLGLAKDSGQLRRFYQSGPRAVRRLQLVHGGGGPVSAAELTRLLVADLQQAAGATVRHDSRRIEVQIAAYRRRGLNAEQIAAHLNHSGSPRPTGSGQWRSADVLDELERAGSQGVPSRTQSVRTPALKPAR